MKRNFRWVAVAIAALVTLLAPSAKASCGSAEAARKALANEPWSFLRPTLAQPAIENAAPAPQDKEGEEPSIAGLWKTVFVSGGAVVTVGFDSWHSDGTEFALDSFPVLVGTYCPGTWEKKGHRTYSTVHPAYNYDPVTGNANSVFIERVHITLSADGKKTFTWSVDGPFPFPFPL